MNAGEIHEGNPGMRDVQSWFALEPPGEEHGLYGRLLFSVKCSLRRRLEHKSLFFANHDDGRSRTRWVRPVIGRLASLLLDQNSPH